MDLLSMSIKSPSLRVFAFLLLASGCVPNVDTDESIIRAPRVIAIKAEPAEGKPDQAVSYTALLVDQNGVRTEADLNWFYCEAQKPLAELGPISKKCLRRSSGKLADIGTGFDVKGSIPKGACGLFGPNPPPPVMGQAPGRPVDPDGTGGYKQPVLLGVNIDGKSDDLVLYEQRLTCDIASLGASLVTEFNLRYHRNENPRVSNLSVQRAGEETRTLEADEVLTLAPGEAVSLFANWDACPVEDSCGDGVCGPDETRPSCAADCGTALVGCFGRERYLWFSNETRELSVRRESMRAAWYTTAGKYDDERTGVDEDSDSDSTENSFTAPNQTGELVLWVVLRDARGGVGSHELKVSVE